MDLIHFTDRTTHAWARALWGTPWLDDFMLDLSALGSRFVLTLVVLFAFGLLVALRRYRTAGFVMAAAVIGVVLSWGVKEIIGRHRPLLHHPLVQDASDTFSFPSGHSMMSAVVYLTLALIATAVIPRARVRVYVVSWSLVVVVLIGISRVYLGVHYASDVVAGWLGGLAWALLCRWVECHAVLRAGRRAEAEVEESTPVGSR